MRSCGLAVLVCRQRRWACDQSGRLQRGRGFCRRSKPFAHFRQGTAHRQFADADQFARTGSIIEPEVKTTPSPVLKSVAVTPRGMRNSSNVWTFKVRVRKETMRSFDAKP